jgi:hypothetical protein
MTDCVYSVMANRHFKWANYNEVAKLYACTSGSLIIAFESISLIYVWLHELAMAVDCSIHIKTVYLVHLAVTTSTSQLFVPLVYKQF